MRAVPCLLSSILAPVALTQSAPPPTVPAPVSQPAPLDAEQIKGRERMALISVSTVQQAEKGYALANGSFFDEIRCLTRPAECIPGLPVDTAPFLDPTYEWLQPRLGYARKFHAGPRPTQDEIRQAKASPSSLRSYAYTTTPLEPGRTGGRAFCGDSGGRFCFTPRGTEPPVKDGRCDPCRKLE